MGKSVGNKNKPEPKPRYTWPWFLLGAVVLAIILAVVWMSNEAARIRRNRDPNFPAQSANEIKTPSQSSSDPSWTNGMAWIPPGTFWMGAEDGQPDERPVHQVILKGFWMDKTEVTNEKFEKFVRATGYVTVAERKPDAKDFPGVPPENRVPGAIVFTPPSLDD